MWSVVNEIRAAKIKALENQRTHFLGFHDLVHVGGRLGNDGFGARVGLVGKPLLGAPTAIPETNIKTPPNT